MDSIKFTPGLQNMIRSLTVPSPSSHNRIHAPTKSNNRLDVTECYKHLRTSKRDGREDAVMLEALELYCSLLTPPSTPSRAAPDAYAAQNHCCKDISDNDYSASILSSYHLRSASPRKPAFKQTPGNDFSHYPRDLAYQMSTPSLSMSDQGSPDFDEPNDRFSGHLTSRSSPTTDQSSYSSYPSATLSAADSDAEALDDPFARSPGVSRVASHPRRPSFKAMQSEDSSSTAYANTQASRDADSRPRITHSMRSQRSQFIFPKPSSTRDEDSAKSHSEVAPEFQPTHAAKSSMPILPCPRTSSMFVPRRGTSTDVSQPLPRIEYQDGHSLAPEISHKTSAPLEPDLGEPKSKFNRARALSVVSFSRHRRSEHSSLPPPLVISLPIPAGQPIPARKSKINPTAPTHGRGRSKTLSNGRNPFSDDLLKLHPLPTTISQEDDKDSKRRSRKSIWKTVKDKSSRISLSVDQRQPPTVRLMTDSFDKQLGRATGGSEMKYPLPTRIIV